MPRWGVLRILLLLVLAAACASRATGFPDGAGGSRGPTAAYLAADRLIVEFAAEDAPVRAVARWSGADAPPGSRSFRAAQLELPGDEETEDAALRAMQPVRVRDRAAWDEVVAAVLRDLAPPAAEGAALTLIQDDAIVFHVTGDGELRVRRGQDRPSDVPVTRIVTQSEFCARADAILRDLVGDAEPVLFATGDADGGESFVLFDFARDQSVLVAAPPGVAPSDVETTLRLLLQLPEKLLVRGHAIAVLTRPVSSAARLVWLATSTAETLVPHDVSAGGTPPPLAEGPGMDLAEWERELDATGVAAPLPGSIEPLIGGEAYFARLAQSVLNARESVCVRLYIFDSDEFSLRFADLLKQRSREIPVRVLVDSLGTLGASLDRPAGARSGAMTFSIGTYLEEDSAVSVRESPNPWFTSDHTKTILVDGRAAYLGGMNVGREYRHEWHDMMVAVEGPIVGRLQHDFDVAWAHAGLGGDVSYALEVVTPPVFHGDTERADFVPLRPIYTRVFDSQILRVQLAAMRRARSRIWVEQPYVAEDALVAAMIEARGRGVDVRVILPTSGDFGFMNDSNLLAASALVRAGVRVFAYPGMTHVKAALYDGWACLGSANFDKLSLRVNRETDLGTSDPGFVGRLARELFEADFARSREITAPPSVAWDTYVAAFVASQL